MSYVFTIKSPTPLAVSSIVGEADSRCCICMARYGAIYIAHNPQDGERVYKVGLTTRSVQERMNDLTSETSNIGRYEALGHIVVSDVETAEAACHKRLIQHRVQTNREFFEADLRDVVVSVRAACIQP